MTENLRSFLEEISRDEALAARVNSAKTSQAVIALAAEKGFVLTAEDLKPEDASCEIRDDELEAVAGGTACACILGGGGEASGALDDTCGCVVAGIGYYRALDENNVPYDEMRCGCPAVGGGTSKG